MELKTPYFKKHLKWLTVLGIDIYPVNVFLFKFLYKLYAIFVVGFVITYALLEIIDIVNTSDFNSMTFGLCYCATHLIGIAKIIIFLMKKKKIREMLDKLESSHFLPSIERGGEEEFRLINSAVAKCARHAEIFNLIVYSIVSIRCLYALFSTEENDEVFDAKLNTTIPIHRRTLPYRLWLPFETSKSPIFEIVFFIQPFTLTLYGYYIGYIDSIVYGMMIHMNTQYMILKRILDRYVLIAKDLVAKHVQEEWKGKSGNGVASLPAGYDKLNLLIQPLQEKIQDIVHYCVKHHIHIIDFCGEVEVEFSYLMLLQFLFSLYTLCFQLYQLSLLANALSFEFISMCCYLTLLMYQLFCYCWYGNEIMVTSGRFSQDLYNSEWLVVNDSIRKSLLLVMMRAQRPIQFTAGKFALLSLQTFMSVSGSRGKKLKKPHGRLQNEVGILE
ncbi:hypothetical protein NQ315_002182, partial [Exocentrus adspersus]